MAKVTLKMQPTQKILLKRNLNKNGNGQKFLTHEIRRLSDAYVPMDTGILKNTAVEDVNRIIYVQPYSKRMWYEHRGARNQRIRYSEKDGKKKRIVVPGGSTGKRGRQWLSRMWADRGDEIVKSVASYCGGRKG